MDGIRNFRSPAGLDVAGGRVAAGHLFRSGHLGNATDDDLQRLVDLGIRTIVDLRTDHDIAAEGVDRLPPGVTHHHLPIEDDAGRGREIRDLVTGGDLEAILATFGEGRSMTMATEAAVDFVRSPALASRFSEALNIVLDPDSWPVLWHCSAGKDRAGWVGTSVLLALGADDQTIVDHYLESNTGAGVLPDEEPWPTLRPFMLVQEEFVRAQLEVVTGQWESPDHMFEDHFGLAAQTLQRFRAAVID